MLVYYKGKGLWYDFPSVDSTKRVNSKNQWNKSHPHPKGRWYENEHDWEQYQADKKEWEQNNPLPEITVIEDNIFLKREVTGLFGSTIEHSKPILSYQPEEAFVQGVFKLKECDALTLRYEKKVTIQILLPCKHIDACNEGFFFYLDKPVILDSESVVSDERNEEENKTIHKNTRAPINERRDTDYLEWLEEQSPDVNNMIKKEIQEALSNRRKRKNTDGTDNLWSAGFEDWVGYTKLYSGIRGRKKGK